MFLKRFYDTKLAHASYLVGCQATGEAIVIDASRHVQPYLEEAKSQGLKIIAATETHIHADYLSGSRQLAHETGAKMYLSKDGDADWQYQFAGENDVLVSDGDIITIGNLTLKVLHTPGHTPEHISFLLTDHPASDEPIGAFTGDFIFVGDVGRPDLLEKAAGIKNTMEKGALVLYQSLMKFAKLPDHIQIWPAHGAGSACGKALGAIPSSVLGYEKKTNWAFRCKDEQEFVDAVLDGQPEPPHYFAVMKKLNKEGPALLSGKGPAHQPAAKMSEVLEKSVLADLRGCDSFATKHPKGAIFLPPGGTGSALVTWAGWILDYNQDFYFLAKSEEQALEAAQALRSIGLDNAAGYFLPEDMGASGVETQSSNRIEASQVDVDKQHILDVRSLKEWNEGHLEKAQHIHLGYLKNRMDEVPDDPVVHCRSGVRSLIASSLLQRAGKTPTDILGGWMAMQKRKVAVPG